MIKIFHESPMSMFKKVQEQTDGDYALVHLFESHPEYFEQFKQAVKDGREVILDNSIFELGTAFNADQFTPWIEKLNPTWYIIPDALEDAETTVANAKQWNFDHPAKKIGVVQGKTLDELVWCYYEIEPLVDMVAISFDYTLYEELGQKDKVGKLHSWMYGRQQVLDFFAHGIVNRSKPHHLLGNALPQEGLYYRGNVPKFEWIYSIDTSNPVVHGLKGIAYYRFGLVDKNSQKLCDLIEAEDPRSGYVRYNIGKFREYWNNAA